jgi:penicillin-binding protein 1A
MTLTNAFAESRNIPALKLAAHVGIQKVIDVAHRFGVTTRIPAYLPVALGAVEITLEEQVASYSVFPNDGLGVKPRLIKKVSNADGVTLWEEPPAVDDVISQQTARTMMTLLEAVTQHGTGAAAAQLNHPLGGKTGTTSDYTDAWFLGFSPSVTCGVWVGFDSNQTLGDKETGARAALPIWINVMRVAIAGKDDEKFLGDEKENPALKASVETPARAAKSSAPAKPHKPPFSSGPAVKPAMHAAAKPAVQPAAGASPRVKPALPPQPVPARPTGRVRPALSSGPNPPKPRNQR